MQKAADLNLDLYLDLKHVEFGNKGKKSIRKPGSRETFLAAALAIFSLQAFSCTTATAQANSPSPHQPPRVTEAQQFLAARGWSPGRRMQRLPSHAAASFRLSPQTQTSVLSTWTPLGPTAVQTPSFGLVTGRVSAIALDPSDVTGNHVYVGTTGGGVWSAQNVAVSTSSTVSFVPLTDSLSAEGGVTDPSISIGALTVQPGGTGVVLAGTGDPNDALDSYYGNGILRSTDSGATWNLIWQTEDATDHLGLENYAFFGEGFAGFAWSTVNPQLVVAAVSQAYEGDVVNAVEPGVSLQGLYYSNDSGATWHLAEITDGNSQDVQGPLDLFPSPDGNAATAVVWNPIRQMFIAAVRYHGYYSSPDGVTWTRLTAQPGAGLTAAMCPHNYGATGSISCPIFRGALAVNPQTGDTFAWTVDINNQDQGLWQDKCNLNGSACLNSSVTFSQQLTTTALETSTTQGSATIADGDYNLALWTVPSQQDTLVFAGANDLWKCSLAMGCQWRNTTNSTTCMSAQVGEFQHALAWNASNPSEILLGNDSGLWRSMDAVGETGVACNSSDSTHFQNLNGSLGSLAEAESVSPLVSSPYNMLAGLGVNGAAGVKAGAATADWPQILGGYGGPVSVDPNTGTDWYVSDQAGVAVYRCSQSAPCTPADFGTSPAITNADVDNDGYAMSTPAPILVDAYDPTRVLVGTCRVWRGLGSGSGWTSSNAISPILDSSSTTGSCQGDALIRSLAAQAQATSEIIYAGTYGSANGGANLPGHVLSATFNPASSNMPAWTDLTSGTVVNDSLSLNYYGFDISSIIVDPHDPSGQTVYVTVAGMGEKSQVVQTVYRSTNGGATWNTITANLPNSPANALAVDPQNANVVYVATDTGVFYTTEVSSCVQYQSECWSAFGAGLPQAPVVALTAAPATAADPVLVAGTYGRGIWQTQLWSAGTSLSDASAAPSSLAFAGQVFGTTSAAQTVTVTNTGNSALAFSSATFSGNGDFSATGSCLTASVAAGSTCTLQVTFTPQATGPRTAQMILSGNIYGGQLSVDLNGTGLPSGGVTLSPSSLSFGQVPDNSTSAALPVQFTNPGSTAVPISSVSATSPFVIASNSCGASIAANSSCQIEIAFAPTQTGQATGLLTFTDGAGTQTVDLSGTGAALATDILSQSSMSFPSTPSGQISAAQPLTITNNGDLPLSITSISAGANFQQSNSCQSGVAAHSVCTVNVQFAPTQSGNLAGSLTLTDQLGVKTVALSGTGLPPGAFTLAPASLTFSQQQPGVPSAPQTITVTNSGGAAMANIGFQITGPAAASYSIPATTCGALLNNGASCTVQIVFTPAATGPIAAILAISSSTPGITAAAAPLNGAGLLSTGLEINPAVLPFTTAIGVGQQSAAQFVTIINTSSYAVASVTLATTGPFSVAQNTCTGAVNPGSTCTASVVFQPTTTGSVLGALTVSSTAVATPAAVALSGAGFSFAVSPSGPTAQTVTSGQQGDYKLVITPTGAQGTFSFQCGTLPSNALCLFNPGSETLGNGVEGNVEVEIYTGSAGLAQIRPASISPASNLPASGLALALCLIPLALRRRGRTFFAVVLATALIAGLSSCTSAIGGTSGSGGSGGSGGQSGSGSTPAGTYTIPITVTSTGLTQTVSLTLTVD
jgi:Abnormal spindle-like microcephaly-assoc'd, ASPM-SPD-2-Hydin